MSDAGPDRATLVTKNLIAFEIFKLEEKFPESGANFDTQHTHSKFDLLGKCIASHPKNFPPSMGQKFFVSQSANS